MVTRITVMIIRSPRPEGREPSAGRVGRLIVSSTPLRPGSRLPPPPPRHSYTLAVSVLGLAHFRHRRSIIITKYLISHRKCRLAYRRFHLHPRRFVRLIIVLCKLVSLNSGHYVYDHFNTTLYFKFVSTAS
jgi:hypothetical protein